MIGDVIVFFLGMVDMYTIINSYSTFILKIAQLCSFFLLFFYLFFLYFVKNQFTIFVSLLKLRNLSEVFYNYKALTFFTEKKSSEMLHFFTLIFHKIEYSGPPYHVIQLEKGVNNIFFVFVKIERKNANVKNCAKLLVSSF